MTDRIYSSPRLIMLCGIPTSGKSSYLRQGLDETPYFNGAVVLSTDDYIEQEAKAQNLTYNEAFEEFIGPATENLGLRRRSALRNNLDIIWDQTNLTPKVRRRKLAQVPSWYERTAVWFDISLEEALRRNKTREGKFIPEDVIKRMHATFVPPTKSEGFGHIIEPLR